MSLSRRVTLGLSLCGALIFIFGTHYLQQSWSNYSPVKQTMSSLAALGAPTQRMMTIVIVIVGLCLLVAAFSLTLPARPGRWLIGAAGTGTLGTAIFPVPSVSENSVMHTFMAGVVLISMCLWPLGAHHYNQSGHWPVSLRTTIAVTVTMAMTGIVFLIHWLQTSPIMGLLERILLAVQLLCFLVLAHRGHREHEHPAMQKQSRDVVDSQLK